MKHQTPVMIGGMVLSFLIGLVGGIVLQKEARSMRVMDLQRIDWHNDPLTHQLRDDMQRKLSDCKRDRISQQATIERLNNDIDWWKQRWNDATAVTVQRPAR